MKFSRLWDRLFPKRAREYLQFPKPSAPPLPWGTILIDGQFPVIADGKGGVAVAVSGYRCPSDRGAVTKMSASRRKPR